MKLAERNVYCVLGVPLDTMTMKNALESIFRAASTRERLLISTVNMNFIALAQRDAAFRKSLVASDLCLTDGVAVKLLCKLLGVPIAERVAGSDILDAIWQTPGTANREPLRVFLFGGTEEANSKAAEAINLHNPEKIICVGNLYPGFGSVEEMSADAVIDTINHSNPDFLIVSLGAQKGQAWIMRNMPRLEAPVISHLGATINFLAGTIVRAPLKWQKLGLEWLWRIKEEPKLAKRYLSDGLTLFGLLLTRVAPVSIWLSWSRWRWRADGFHIDASAPQEGPPKVVLRGSFTSADVRQFEQVIANELIETRTVSLDLSALNWIDTRSMGCLIILNEALKKNRGILKFECATANLQRAFALNGLGDIETD